MRLGFPVRAVGCPASIQSDGGGEGERHLSLALMALGDMVRYLSDKGIRLYRLHARTVPQWAGQDANAWAGALDENARMLELLTHSLRTADLRLTLHPYADVVLNAPDAERVEWARGQLDAQARLLQALGQGREGSIVLHVGGVYGDARQARERFCASFERLSPAVQTRLALEHDDRRFDLADVLWIQARCGVPIVFDTLHHRVLNRSGLSRREGLESALGSWPEGLTPLIHYAAPRSEMRRARGDRIKAPTWTEHADYVNPFEFADWLYGCEGLPDFDIMLEAKARDLALLQLRQDLVRFSPQLLERHPGLA